MQNFMRDFSKFKEKITPNREYREQEIIKVVNDLDFKMKELAVPYKTLQRIKSEAERIRIWRA